MNPTHEVIGAFVASYEANRPAELPAEVAIYPAMRKEEKKRPCSTVSLEGQRWLHPKLFQCTVVFTIESRSEDVPTVDDLASWAGAIEGAMLPLVPDIINRLEERGVRLTFIYPENPAEDPDGEDGFIIERRWNLRLRVINRVQWSDGSDVLWSDGTNMEFSS